MAKRRRYGAYVYLGKENYQFYKGMADVLGCTMSELLRVVIHTGTELANLDKDLMKVIKNGGQQA